MAWIGQLPSADPASVGFEDAVACASAAVATRLPGADRVVRAWPAEFRRLAALRVHVSTVTDSYDRAPDDSPARLMPVLIDDTIRWSRAELAWALRTADDYAHFDGGAYLLPGYIAASLNRVELAGFGRALRAVFDDFITERDTPRPVRPLLGKLYGTAIGCLAGRLPLDLLPWQDPFGEFVRKQLDRRLDEPGVTVLFRHATALNKVLPPKAWLRVAASFPADWPVRLVLECFADHAGPVRSESDELLRGLVWMLSLDPSPGATELLGRVAITAGSSGERKRGYVFAPQTAAAAIEILTGRSGEVPARALTELSRIVVNKALLARVRTALAQSEPAIQ